jgi:oxygen-dependent protoporphyrinogen oxidase
MSGVPAEIDPAGAGDHDGRPHVVVVGGGVAGLVAARELLAGGLRVTLVEASARLGGKLQAHEVGGIRLDAGAESFATRGGTVAELLVALGLGDAVVSPSPRGAWLLPVEGPAVPLPRAGLLGIPSVPLARDVIAVVGLAGALRAQLDSLLPGLVGSRSRDLGTLVRLRMGRAVLDRLVAPITTAVHSTPPTGLALARVAPRLTRAMVAEGSLARAVQRLRGSAPAGSAVQGIDGGMSRLVDGLAAAIAGRAEVLLGTRVSAVDDAGVVLAGGRRIPADHVIVATELGDPTGAPITLATLVVECPALDAAPRGSGVIVAAPPVGGRASGRASESRMPVRRVRAKALTHATAKWEWLAREAGGRHVLRLSYERAPESDAELRELARTDAELLLGVTIGTAAVVAFDRQEWRGAGAAPGPVEAGPVPAGPAGRDATGTPSGADEVPSSPTHVGERLSGAGLAGVIASSTAGARSVIAHLDGTVGIRWSDL